MKELFTFLVLIYSANVYSQHLHIDEFAEDGSDRTLVTLNNLASGNRGSTSIEMTSGEANAKATAYIGLSNLNYTGIPQVAGYLNVQSGSSITDGNGINFRCANPTGDFRYFIGGYQPSDIKMILDPNGNLGIGNSSPNSKLQVSDGDIYIEDINQGVIMKSPNGTCWRMTILDSGAVNTAMISCP